MSIRRRLRSALWRIPVEQEVRDELSHHVDLRTEELVERGLPREVARAEAIRRLGEAGRLESNLTRLGRERDRTAARREWLAEVRQDVAFSLRQCRLYQGFTIAAVLTLAIGIGAATAIFSVVNAVVLAPLPVADPARVLYIYTTWRGQMGATSVGNYDYIRQRQATLEQLAAVNYSSFNLSDEGAPERVLGLRATWSLFPVIGIAPLYGRAFTEAEDRPDVGRVVVLSYRLWQRRFGGDAAIVGRQVRLSGVPYQVIGIMPPAVEGVFSNAELFVPISFTPAQLAMYDEHYLDLYGRRKPDASLALVVQDLDRVTKQLTLDHPDFNRDRGSGAQLLSTFLVGDYRLRLFVLQGAVLLVLMIACVNVANLLLARLAARSRELAIRAAIGAGRGRIVRQVLTESLVLSILGGLAGVVLAWWMLPMLIARAPQGVPRLAEAGLSAPVIAAACGLVLVTTMLVGLLPALQTLRGPGLQSDLGDGKGASSSAVRPWVRQTLIAAQAALVLVVLAGAALLVRSSIKLNAVPIGFDTSGILSARLALPSVQYGEPAAAHAAFRSILERLQASSSIALAALDSQPPLVGGGGSNGLIPEHRPYDLSSAIISRSHFVTPDYFKLLRVPLRAGRGFTDQDLRAAPLVMIINETLARVAFDGQDPLGKRIACCEGAPGRPAWKTVVGVVADVKSSGPAPPLQAEFYLPLAQIPDAAWTWTGRTMNVMARSAQGDPAALTPVMRDAVRSVDPTLPLYAIRTMDEGLRQTMAQARFNTGLMTLLGLTGLVLAALGIYSVIAWLVAQRTREIGLRMALGASATDVIRQVTLHALAPVAVGLIVGAAGALATGGLLEKQLFDVGARDPVALASVVGAMLVVGVVAGMLPAMRAARIDPSRALHEG
jgi:putative ABC transport system permease protein